MVQYGRDNAGSWNLKKARQLDEAGLRRWSADDLAAADAKATQGGEPLHEVPSRPVAWLIGSSVLRDAFDEARINAALEERGSGWRVAKFGQTRGAAGVSVGMLDHLPIRPGDRVVHNVLLENFRTDWLSFTDLPAWRILLVRTPSDLWNIKEWDVQKKLEEAMSVPADFFRYHDETMEGWRRWYRSPIDGVPKPRKKSFHTKFRKAKDKQNLDLVAARGEASGNFIPEQGVSFGSEQFNVAGLEEMRARCDDLGVEFTLVHLPPRPEFMEHFVPISVQDRWMEWRGEQPELVEFQQQVNRHYYDMKHPNSKGRGSFSKELVDWLVEAEPGD